MTRSLALVRRIARAILPAPRPRVSRDARRLALKYAAATYDVQHLIDDVGVERAELCLFVGRATNESPFELARYVDAKASE